MNYNSWKTVPSSFAETVRLVEEFVVQEIIQETKEKQLYYHTLDHAIAVKRRANSMLQKIQLAVLPDPIVEDFERTKYLIQLCALAHDMVQIFSKPGKDLMLRSRTPGISEAATVDKLIQYITNLNQALIKARVEPTILFSQSDLAAIEEIILATICKLDPQAGKLAHTFSAASIYQPYLYESSFKTSLSGKIIALADLGTLGMDGVEAYIQEGILIFLEDNLDIKKLISNCDSLDFAVQEAIRVRLLNMAKFMVNLAREREVRFEIEISGFCPQIRRVLREEVFIHLNHRSIEEIEEIIPTAQNTSLIELINFFGLSEYR